MRNKEFESSVQTQEKRKKERKKEKEVHKKKRKNERIHDLHGHEIHLVYKFRINSRIIIYKKSRLFVLHLIKSLITNCNKIKKRNKLL